MPTRSNFWNRALTQFPLWPLFFGVFSGVFLADSWETTYWVASWISFFCGGFIIGLITRNLAVSLLITGFILGYSSHGFSLHQQNVSLASAQSSQPPTISITAVVLDTGPRGDGPYLAKITPPDSPSAQNLPPGVKLVIYPNSRSARNTASVKPLRYGDLIQTRGIPTPIPSARNPYAFDRQQWRHRQGADISLISDTPLISQGVSPFHRPVRILSEWRIGLASKMTAGLDPNSTEAQLIHAVVLGERPPRSSEMIDDFRLSGTLHVFAVSGLHVGMVGSILALLFWLTRAPRWLIITLTICGMILYAGITGLRPPAVRAVIMASVFLSGFLLQRRPTLINSLAASAIIVLLWDGHQLFTPGFQLSYGVLLAIALLAQLWMRILRPIAQLDPFMPRQLLTHWQEKILSSREKLRGALSVSCAAWMGSAPLIWIYFGLITPIAIIAGLPLMLMVFAILALAMASCAIGALYAPAGEALNHLNALIARTTHHTASLFADTPFGHFYRQPSTPDNGQVIIFDIPHGGAANLLQFGNGTLLDSGRSSAFRYEMLPALDHLRLSPQSLILSHADTQHIGGMSQCVTRYHPTQALIPRHDLLSPSYKTFLKTATSTGCRLITPHQGDTFPLETGNPHIFLEILHAPVTLSGYGLADDTGLVIRLHWNDWKILFMGDAGITTETRLLASEQNLHADVIVMGHHTDDISAHPSFLRAVAPQVIISSSADFPANERIQPEWKKQLSSLGIILIDQQFTGGVILTQNDKQLTLTPTLTTASIQTLTHR